MSQPGSLERSLNELLVLRRFPTFATAESCTGGTVAARITSIAGSSAYFLGGVVAYDNSIKRNILCVSESILESVGAVSSECAEAMAEGVRALIGADLAVSTTGIAGPGGATDRKPVGLVYIGIATPAGVESHEYRFSGDRARVIGSATEEALRCLLTAVEAELFPAQVG